MELVTPNQSLFYSYTEFVLLGFPGISQSRYLLGIPFLSLYAVILTGNSAIVYLICSKKTLHSPMYLLISLLFAIHIANSMCVMPPFILGLIFHTNQITLIGCLMQMFFIYFLAICESSVILLMSLDRYIAICRPLHYNNIITKRLLAWMTLIVLCRSCVLVSPLVVFTSMVPFCRDNIILNFVCENMALLSLGCGDISKPQVAGLIVRILVTVFDVSLLLLSYSNILYMAMKTVSGKSRHKALSTCGTHLIVAMLVYLCALVSSIVYRIEMSLSVDAKNLFTVIYLILPATLNPFIYGLRLKEIRRSIWKNWIKTNTSDIQ